MLNVWFGADLQIEKHWSEVTSGMTHMTQTWFERWLYLKEMVCMAGAFLITVITFCITVVPCPVLG